MTAATSSSASATSELALAGIEARAAEILQDGKLPLLLGGEHLVTLGAVRAAVKKYPDLHIVHFDAHADLRDDYLGAKLMPRLCPPPLLGAGRRRAHPPVRHPERGPGRV